MVETGVFFICVAILISLGIYEKKVIRDSVKKIDLRINVNGIRGKSTATRFITAILQDAGYQVVGKTTGTSARMILWDKEEEIPINRRPIGPNISEQVKVLKQAADLKANALVCECMAVNPEYQIVYQHQIVQANIVVITNVVEDHLDLMGPTTEQISWAFAATIPYNGILVITEGPYAEYFKAEAEKRNTKVVCVDPESVEESYLREFPYMVFPNNCAVGLAFAEAMGIDKKQAMKAMLKAHPDPGSTQIVKIEEDNNTCHLINAFAANEPTSSLEIWQQVCNGPLHKENAVLIICCRDDRVDRSHQFVEDFLPYINIKTMVIIGTGTLEVLHEFQKGRFSGIEDCIDLTDQKSDVIIEEVKKLMCNNVVFCAGNIHGVAEEFLDKFASIKI